LSLTNNDEFAIQWFGNGYRFFDHCITRPESGSSTEFFTEISPWGYIRDNGFVSINPDTRLLIGDGCGEVGNYNIQIVEVSRSIFDAPNMTPFEPFYFLGFYALSIFIFIFALKLLFGRGYK